MYFFRSWLIGWIGHDLLVQPSKRLAIFFSSLYIIIYNFHLFFLNMKLCLFFWWFKQCELPNNFTNVWIYLTLIQRQKQKLQHNSACISVSVKKAETYVGVILRRLPVCLMPHRKKEVLLSNRLPRPKTRQYFFHTKCRIHMSSLRSY